MCDMESKGLQGCSIHLELPAKRLENLLHARHQATSQCKYEIPISMDSIKSPRDFVIELRANEMMITL